MKRKVRRENIFGECMIKIRIENVKIKIIDNSLELHNKASIMISSGPCALRTCPKTQLLFKTQYLFQD